MRMSGQYQHNAPCAKSKRGVRIMRKHQQRICAAVIADMPRVVTAAPAVADTGYCHAATFDDLILDHAHAGSHQRFLDRLELTPVVHPPAEFAPVMIAKN